MSQSLDISWDEYNRNTVNTFSTHRKESNFHDVTLVCSDMVKIKAHKMVLSSCSDYFKSLLEDIDQHNPYICIENISSEDMNKVLDFIYLGSVKIKHEALDRFLLISTRLKIYGIDIDSVKLSTIYIQ